MAAHLTRTGRWGMITATGGLGYNNSKCRNFKGSAYVVEGLPGSRIGLQGVGSQQSRQKRLSGAVCQHQDQHPESVVLDQALFFHCRTGGGHGIP